MRLVIRVWRRLFLMIEVATFRLREGVTAEEYHSVDKRLQTDFFYQQPGLVRRTTACANDGSWITIIFWESVELSQLAVTKAVGRVEFSAALAMIDVSTMQTSRYRTT